MNFVFLLEEPSARVLIEQIFSKIYAGESHPQIFYLVFQGKQDLEKNVELKIRAWSLPNSVFLVLRDQDAGNCQTIKRNLLEKVAATGKSQKTLIRIACKELESWYFGDLQAVEEAMGIEGLHEKYGNKATYRITDEIVNPADELYKITDLKYQKINGSREIGRKMDPSRNKSSSFKAFVGAMNKLLL